MEVGGATIGVVDELPLFVDLEGISGDGSPHRPVPVETSELSADGAHIVRVVRRRDGSVARSSLPAPADGGAADLGEAYDLAWLRATSAPPAPADAPEVRVVDLFSGCGGMTVGVVEACRALGMAGQAVLAVDSNKTALATFARNFPGVRTLSDPVESWLDGELGAAPTEREREFAEALGRVDVTLAGPPCQGNSNLNNHTRYADPKNELYLRVVRFAEVVRPRHVVIENVPGVRRDKKRVLDKAYAHLERLGYNVAVTEFRAERLGVAQTRHRVLVLASLAAEPIAPLKRDARHLETLYGVDPPRPFSWACGDLEDAEGATAFDRTADADPVTEKRIAHLFDHDLHVLPDELRPACHEAGHTYKAVYGRMWWDRPAPTITSGYMTMGRGRFVHPRRRRTLTPHEAARVQFFPDYFDFSGQTKQAYKVMIGNAVPPKLTYLAALELLR